MVDNIYTGITKSTASQPKLNSPEVLRFEAEIILESGKVVVEVPVGVSRKLRGMEKVEGMMNGQSFRAVIELGDNGDYVLHVGAAMLRGADAKVGDTVQCAILGPEPDPVPPTDLQKLFDISPQALAIWGTLTTLGKRDWVRWIEDAKTPETRTRRISRAVEQLAEGKRRACCVNVNGYMMLRIKQDEDERK